MPAPQQTVLLFINHASLFIRCGDSALVTDPWYSSRAFTSWSPVPPPALNPAMLIGLARAGKLGFLISHAHPDHADAEFLAQLPADAPVYIPRFRDRHMLEFLHRAGLANVHEVIPDQPARYGSFVFDCFPSATTEFDAAFSIETPDAFLFHGNDAWTLDAESMARLAVLKPAGKASLFMGQGASASGHPLTYFCFDEGQRPVHLADKNAGMIRALATTADAAGFDHILAYACFTRIDVDGRDYSFKAPTVTADFANAVSGSAKFIDLSPGDFFIPVERRTVNVLASLHVPQAAFAALPTARHFPPVSAEQWAANYAAKLDSFIDGFISFLRAFAQRTNVPAAELGLALTFHVRGDDGAQIEKTWRFFDGATGRRKVCRINAAVLAAILDRQIPLEDAYTGYLAEWSREPADVYNRRFIDALTEYGYAFYSDDAPADARAS